MTKIIALFNQSGGVGKTTLTMNLGYQLGIQGHRVLLVDIDPQASLTTFMGLEPVEIKQTVYDAIMKSEPLAIQSDIYGIDLAPANITLSAAEMELVVAEMREVRLKDALEQVKENYDFILIDCPPSLGVLSYISLVAANYVLVPIETQFKAFCGTDLLLNTIARLRARANPKLKIAGFIPTQFDSRTSQDDRTLKAINDQLANYGTIFSPISRSTGFADASEKRIPLAKFNAKHPGVVVMSEIVKSLEKLA